MGRYHLRHKGVEVATLGVGIPPNKRKSGSGNSEALSGQAAMVSLTAW